MSAQPIAVVTGGAGFIGSHMVDLLLDRGYRVRVIDNLVGGREANLAHHAGEPRLAFEQRDIRGSQPGDALFDGRRLRVPLRRHRRHRAFDRAADRLHDDQRPGHRARAGMRARGEGARSSSTPRRRPATASPPRRPARTIRSRPQYPYALSKYQGEQAALALAPGLPAAGQLDPHLQRLRPARRAPPAPMARCSASSSSRSSPASRSPWSATARRRRDFLYVTDIAEAFLRAAETRLQRGDLEPRRRQSADRSTGWSNCSAARSCTFRSGRASPTAPGRTSRKITRDLGWKPEVPFEEGVRRMMADIELLARCAAVGPAVDREGHQDLVRVSAAREA